MGFIRRNLFVPVRQLDKGLVFNRHLLDRCMELSDKPHWAKGENEKTLFMEDRFAPAGLPGKPFDAVKWERHRADKYGKVCLEGKHRYSSDPSYAGCELICGLRAYTVVIADGSGTVVCEHARAYGSAPSDTEDPASQLSLLARKPGGFKNSQVRASLTEGVRAYMDTLGTEDPKRTLRVMRDASSQSGWEGTLRALDASLKATGTIDAASVMVAAMGLCASLCRIRGTGRPFGLRPCIEEGGAREMPIARKDADAFKAKARLMYFSNDTIDHMIECGTAGQLRCICEAIDFEQEVRERRKRERLFRKVAFPQMKSFEGYDFSQLGFPEGYGKDDLMSLGFIDSAQDFVFYGQTGRGKTHLAIAVGTAAVEKGKRVRFFTTAQLIMRLSKAAESGALESLLADIARADLLILDEFGYIPTDAKGARLLFQVVSDCYEKRSLILTTNIEFSRWGTILGDDKLASAMMDRIIHHGRLIEFGGESKRMGASLMLGKGKE